MTKSSNKTNWTVFKNLYNNFKIATTMSEVSNLLKNYKDDGKHAVALGVLKENISKPPKYFTDFAEKTNKIFQQILDRLGSIEENQTKDHNLLLKVIKLNNLRTK